jgi:nucleoside-diphosphate-sugar epimerase
MNELVRGRQLHARIIGKGMIAQALASSMDEAENAIFFASGVSDSQCTDSTAFARERGILAQALADCSEACHFVYFGTCSVYDPSETDSMYVQHKLACEEMVTRHQNGLVVRMPQVAGRAGNRNTFCHWMFDAVRSGAPFVVYANATRNVIDVDDAARILMRYLRDPDPSAKVIDIANPTSYPIEYYLRISEKLLNRVANYSSIAKGSKYQIQTPVAVAVAPSLGIDFSEGYVERVFLKNFI